MKCYQLLEDALKLIGVPVKYYEYLGTEKNYIVYNEEAEETVNYGDNQPLNRIAWCQVHIFSERTGKFREYKEDAITKLKSAGFTVTDAATLYEKETKTIHVVISCHIGEKED